MSFQSAQFFFFLFVTLILYYAVPARAKIPVLLAASWIFYACAGTGYLVLLCAASLLAFFLGHALGRARAPGARRAILAAGLVLLLGNLCFFKYYDLFGKQLAIAASNLNWGYIPPDTGLAAPLGVSFYTFALSGYLIDIYRRKYEPERNFVHLALLAGFFPIVSSGPIERGGHLLAQLRAPHPFEYETFCRGASRMLWGFFKKFVVANTIAGMVDKVFADLTAFSGPYLFLAALLYSYQLYCDFSGYSDIAIGTARLLGLEVLENFERPFAARSFNDLWRRWHISLTSWFREYLYFPLGGSRRGTARTYLNILIIFLVSGIWHGTGLTFAVWGLLNGVYMVIGRASSGVRARLAARNPLYRNRFVKAVIQIALVYLLFTSCIVFFRAQTMSDAMYVYAHLLTGWVEALLHPGTVIATLKTMGIGRVTGLLLLTSITFTEWVEWRAARAGARTGQWLRAQKPVRRIALYYVMLAFLALFGVLGSSSFIYFAF